MIHNPTSAGAEVPGDVQRYDMYIGGGTHTPVSGEYIPTDNPYTGKVGTKKKGRHEKAVALKQLGLHFGCGR